MEEKINKHARALSKIGASKGGKARASVLTPEERKEISQKAIKTRWAKKKGVSIDDIKSKEEIPLRQIEPDIKLGPDSLPVGNEADKYVSLFKGDVHFGNSIVPCHVLNNGIRVIAQREVIKVLTDQEKPSGSITRIIGNTNLLPYINPDDIAKKVIQYTLSGAGHQMSAYGYEATLLIEVCEAFLRARDDGVLTTGQQKISRKADIILRACAKVGIIALIDEATGYQEYRQKNALQIKLQAFIADDMQEWAVLFPEAFWIELARLEHTHYSPRSRPLRWGKYVMAFVYDAVDSDIGHELRRLNPNPHHGMNHHQWLKTFGREKVRDHINQVIGVMKTCQDMHDFNRKFGHIFNKDPMQTSFFDLVDQYTSNSTN